MKRSTQFKNFRIFNLKKSKKNLKIKKQTSKIKSILTQDGKIMVQIHAKMLFQYPMNVILSTFLYFFVQVHLKSPAEILRFKIVKNMIHQN